MSLYDVLRSFVITEKTVKLHEAGKYTFRVDTSANKESVAKAVEKVFAVSVASVNMINVAGKTKRFKGRMGTRSDVKKAIVTLNKGQSINVYAGV